MRNLVVVLNWNNAPDTLRCVKPLKSDDFEVLIVDNGSTDHSPASIQEAAPWAYFLQHTENGGFSRGVNVGLRWGLEHGYDAFLLLNNDAVVSADAVSAGFEQIATTSVGLLTGLVLKENGATWYGGGSLRRFRGGVRIWNHHQPAHNAVRGRRRVSFVSLAFAFVRADTLQAVGLLDESYFFGMEEWDYSLRVSQSGRDLIYDAALRCVHSGDGSHRNSDPAWIYNGYRNKLIFQSTHLPAVLLPVWLLLFKLYALTLAPLVVPRLHHGQATSRTLRLAATRALIDHRRLGARVEAEHLTAFSRWLNEQSG